MKNLFLTGAVALGLGLSTSQSYAAESPRATGPIGGTDMRQAVLPPPGLYGFGVLAGVDFLGAWDNKGNVLDASGRTFSGGGGLLYVYDAELFGGRLASSFSASVSDVCVNLKGVYDQCSTGIGDAYSDLLMWSRLFPSSEPGVQPTSGGPIPYGLAVMLGVGVNIPIGKYTSDKIINNGANVWDIAPNVALTYTTPSLLGESFGQATEFSGRVWFNNYLENKDTDYLNGRLINVDFAVTQRHDSWQYGIAGSYYTQIEADQRNGIDVGNGGRRANLFSLGPVVSHTFTVADRPYTVKAKALFGINGENTLKANGAFISISTKLF